MSAIRELAFSHHAAVAASLGGFPPGPGVDLLTCPPGQKPPVRAVLPAGETADLYAESFLKRVELLGVPVQRVEPPPADGGPGVAVDISERTGRRPNRFPGVLEIPQAVVWYGLDFFSHIRADSVRRTVRHFDRLMAVANHLADETSRETLYAIVADQLSGVPYALPRVSMPYSTQYFGTGLFDLATDEVVLDAGAADGDSFRKFLAVQPHLEGYFAFEPDPKLYPMLTACVQASPSGSRAVAERTPLTERSGPVWMDVQPGTGNTHLTAGSEAGKEQFQAVSIDDYLAGRRVSTLKMDVEGAELPLLRGAEQSIRRHHPKLLISVYHEVEQLFEVPEYIRSLSDRYRLYLRNHTWASADSSWPGSFFCETVLYAV